MYKDTEDLIEKLEDKEIALAKLSQEEILKKDQAYTQLYALDSIEYQKKWHPIRASIFDLKARWWAEMMFQPGVEFIFDERKTVISYFQFTRLQKCMQALGEKEFVLIQNELHCRKIYRDTRFAENPYKLKFPANITYPALIDGGLDTLDMVADWWGIHDFFIFSESGKWAIYSPGNAIYFYGNDRRKEIPLFTIGFRKEVEPLFAKVFKDLTTEKKKKYIVEKCLPPTYQKYDKYLR